MAQIGTNGDDPETTFNNTDPVIYGLDGDDFIRYTGEPVLFLGGAYIEGGRGNDTIYSGPGGDTVYGGDGDDLIHGGSGGGRRPIGDYLYGGEGNDTIYGDQGSDTIFGDGGNDIIYGPSATARLHGGTGNDIIYAGNDGSHGTVVYGDEGNDTLYGMKGARVLFGGDGSDSYEITTAGQMVFETEAYGTDKMYGRDTVYSYVSFALPDNVEVLDMTYGTQAYGYGNNEANLIFGNAQGNVIEGKGGYDTLTGGAGSDLFVVNPGFGVDLITDFVAGAGTQDAVIFSSALFQNFAQVYANSAQVGADTWIGDGYGNTVVLQNVARTTLHSDDFGFV